MLPSNQPMRRLLADVLASRTAGIGTSSAFAVQLHPSTTAAQLESFIDAACARCCDVF
jgi:hypothetical protein